MVRYQQDGGSGQSPNTATRTVQTLTLDTVDGARFYKLYVPTGGSENRPVLMYLHGGGQSFGFLENSVIGERLIELSERERVVLVVPNGTDLDTGSFYSEEDDRGGIMNRQRWNDDRLEDQPLVELIDDVAFLSDLVQRVHERLRTDGARTYVAGPSNGGYMTQKLLLERPSLFAAGASVIAGVPVSGVDETATIPTPILLWFGTEDPLVEYDGSAAVLSGRDSIQWWANHNGHTGEREMVRVSQPDEAGCYTTLQKYDGDVPVYGYVSHGGGHILSSTQTHLPGGAFLNSFIGRQCADIEGFDLMWDFVSRFEREQS